MLWKWQAFASALVLLQLLLLYLFASCHLTGCASKIPNEQSLQVPGSCR